MVRAAALILAFAAPAPLAAADFGGLAVGMGESEARQVLGTHGPFTLENVQGSRVLMGKQYQVTLCAGRVASVNHELPGTFAAFVEAAANAEQTLGKPSAETIRILGQPFVSALTLSWRASGGNLYRVSYAEGSVGPSLTEQITNGPVC